MICDARPYSQIDDEEDYVIFTTGKIYSKRLGRFLKTTIDFNSKSGYPRENVELKCNGARRHCAVSRLLALTFIPNPEGLPLVDHINKNSLDNRLENLRWITYRGNRINSKSQKNNKLNIKHIHKDKKGNYCIRIVRGENNFATQCSTLEHAILVRNAMLDMLGEPFENLD